jgi:hypothetical protein
MLKRHMSAIGMTKTSSSGRRLFRRGRRDRAFALTMVVVTALSLSGCFSTGFTYISRRSPDGMILGFKLPSKWATFNTKQAIEAPNGPLSTSVANSIGQGEWVEAFSAAPHPNANFYATAQTSKYPVGFASALPLTEAEHDSLTYSSMRAQILGTDPEGATDPDPYVITGYSEFSSSSDGLRGSRLTVNIKLGTGATATLSQIVEVDAGTNWLFDIVVMCSAACWSPNSGEINQVLKSWTVKETKS